MDEKEILQRKNEKGRRKSKKLLLLVFMLTITLIATIASTYAWFIGINVAKVNDVTLNIVTDETLEISLDGYTWGSDVTINETTIRAHGDGEGLAYVGNSNSWIGEDGLVPVSSSGDNTNGKLDIFNKNSLSTTAGGLRIRSEQINNASTEENSYVAFDIFVKNKSGDSYVSEYNLYDDENIFLTGDSTVTGTANGETAYGIQNSVRVAFVQIGRISIDDLEDNTTPVIKGTAPAEGETYTTLCDKYSNVYRTVIWEPNNLAHDTKAVEHYNDACRQRIADTPVYSTSLCTDITAGYVPTYTIKRDITSANKVDIYDGLNSYTYDVQEDTDMNTKYLQNTKTFTDTMKATEGYYTLLKLAPHSVTKIRVYVYLEGQDVDNYDLVTKDKNITVSFGLTRDRVNVEYLYDDENVVLPIVIAGQAVNLDITYHEEYLVWENWIEATKNYETGGITCNSYVCMKDDSTYVYKRGLETPTCADTDRIYYKISSTNSIYSDKTGKIDPQMATYFVGTI